MKIGIVVYSQTGHTLSVAERLHDSLKSKGKDVTLAKIGSTRNMKNNPSNFEITKAPKIDNYDIIIFASYVEAFMLCPVMKRYLSDVTSLKGKKVWCFVTEQFPYAWMGGNKANRKIASICKEKGATVEKAKVINWGNKKREDMIKKLINDFDL